MTAEGKMKKKRQYDQRFFICNMLNLIVSESATNIKKFGEFTTGIVTTKLKEKKI